LDLTIREQPGPSAAADGTIVECEGEGEDVKLTISFPGYGRKKLMERYAALEQA